MRRELEEDTMPQYVIERELAGAGKLTPAELQAISATSCGVLRDLGPSVQWVHSYVTDDKIYCVYNAPNEALVREHARMGGFPANSVAQVRSVISPITAEG
jgi:hypothetical protein